MRRVRGQMTAWSAKHSARRVGVEVDHVTPADERIEVVRVFHLRVVARVRVYCPTCGASWTVDADRRGRLPIGWRKCRGMSCNAHLLAQG